MAVCSFITAQPAKTSDSAGNVALDFGEPVFDLVEPGTISGGAMQREVWMVGKQGSEELRFVGGEVIHDEVDFLAGGLSGYDLLEKADKLLAGVAAGSACANLAAPGLEGGIKGEGAVDGNTRTHGAQRVTEKAAAQDRAGRGPGWPSSRPHRRRRHGLAGPDRVQ